MIYRFLKKSKNYFSNLEAASCCLKKGFRILNLKQEMIFLSVFNCLFSIYLVSDQKMASLLLSSYF